MAPQTIRDFGSVLPASETGMSPIGQAGQAYSNSTINNAQNALNGLKGQPNQAPVNPGQGGFWGDLQRLAPTIGSVVGGVGGNILGGLLTIPTGGIVNPWDTGIALAGLGGGIGQVVQNATESKNPFQTNDLTSAALGAAGQAGGELLGSGLSAVGGALSKYGVDAATQATTQAASDVADQAYSAVPKGLRQAYDMNGSNALAQSLGIDTNNLGQYSQQAWGANNALNSRLNGALGNETIDTSGYNKLLDALNAKATQTAGGAPIKIAGLSPENQAVVDAFDRAGAGNTAAKGYISQLNAISGKIGDTANAGDLRQASQDIYGLWKDATPTTTAMTGAKDPIQVALHDALGKVYGNVSDMLYKDPAVLNAVKSMTPDISAEEVGGSQALADRMNVAIKSGDPQAIKNALQETGNMGKIADAAQTAAKGVIPNSSAPVAEGGLKGLVGKITGNKMGILPEAAGIYESTVGKKPDIGMPLAMLGMLGPAGAEGLGGLLTRAAGTAIPGAIGSAIAESPTTMQQGAGGVNTAMPSDLQNSALSLALSEALASPQIAQDYGGMGNLIKLANQAGSVQSSMKNVANTAQQAGVGQGPLMGLLAQLGQTITGGPASLLNNNLNQQEQAAEQALQAAGMSNTAMPTMTQNQQTAQTNIDNMRNLLSRLGGAPSQYSSL